MKKKKIRWWNVLTTVFSLTTIALLLAIPQLNKIANASRIKSGYGGECFMWTLPLTIAIFCSIKESERLRRKGERI